MAWQVLIDDNFTNANTSVGAAGTTTGVPTQGGWKDIAGSTWNILSNKLQGASASANYATTFLIQQNSGQNQDQRIFLDIDASAGGVSSQQTPIAVLRYQTATKNCYFANCDFRTNKLYLFTLVNGNPTLLGGTGDGVAFTYVAGHIYQLELYVTGVNPTTVTANIYDTNSGTPGTPVATVSVTDSTASLQTIGSYGINNTNDSATGNLLITRARTYGIAATALNFSNVPSTFTNKATSFPITVSSNGFLGSSFTVTPSDGGAGGTFTPASLTLSSSTPSATFTYKPANTGSVTITTTNTSTLTNPSSTVSVNPQYLYNSNMVVAPYIFRKNVDVSGNVQSIQSNCQGAYLKFAFTGSTKVGLFIDVATQIAASVDPTNIKIRVSINGGTTTDYSLPSTSGELIFATGLTSGSTYTCRVDFVTMVESYDRWTTPVNIFKISNISLISGGSLVAIANNMAVYTKKALFYGDSITQGYGAPAYAVNDAYYSWVRGVAEAFKCEYGQRGFGGVGWNWTGNGNVVNFYDATNPQSWDHYDSATSMLTGGSFIEGTPDYIFVNMGTNDQNNGVANSTVQTKAQAWFSAIRAAAPTAMIYIIIPFGGHCKAPITSAMAAYNAANPYDAKIFLLDLTPGSTYGIAPSNFLVASETSFDGVHPSAVRNIVLGSMVVQAATSGVSATASSRKISNGRILLTG